MIIERVYCPANKWTFKIKPIAKLLQEEMKGDLWVDPYCGLYSPAQIKNDIDPNIEADNHQEALVWLKTLESNSVDGIIHDPPYSLYEVHRCYKAAGLILKKTWGTLAKLTAEKRDHMARIIKPNGKIISFGWSSIALGKGRGFQLDRVLLVCHGGLKNDTIVTVEKKMNYFL